MQHNNVLTGEGTTVDVGTRCLAAGQTTRNHSRRWEVTDDRGTTPAGWKVEGQLARQMSALFTIVLMCIVKSSWLMMKMNGITTEDVEIGSQTSSIM